MPRIASLLLALALGAISAGALTACGSDDEGAIPQASADSMLASLQRARDAELAGNCDEVQQIASAVSDEAQQPNLPADVREGITDGAEQLFRLAGDSASCGGDEESDPTTTKTKETTSSTPTTTTTEETTTTTAPPTTVPEQPEEEGGDLGEGDSGGTPPDTGSGGTEGEG